MYYFELWDIYGKLYAQGKSKSPDVLNAKIKTAWCKLPCYLHNSIEAVCYHNGFSYRTITFNELCDISEKKLKFLKQ